MAGKKHPVVEQIEDDVEQLVEGLGYELVLIKYSGPARRPTLTVFVDREGGITVDECARISERLSVLLDMLDPIPMSYSLVVSSPGVERPLVRERDFIRFAGRRATVTRHPAHGQRRSIVGTLRGVKDGAVLLEHEGRTEQVPLDEIEDAHLVFEWDG